MVNLKRKVEILSQLGQEIQLNDQNLGAVIEKTYQANPWFTPSNCKMALSNVANAFLKIEKIEKFVSNYNIGVIDDLRKVGLVMAGNIPLVAFHDMLCCFLSGNQSIIKLSDKDKYLLPWIVTTLEKIEPETSDYFQFVDRLKNFDVVIATGSNNSATYFEYYFKDYPRIIRKNRNGVAILTGNETHEDLQNLGKDMFSYFGLGCRNVSKLYAPEQYDFTGLLSLFEDEEDLLMHNKYRNNYDYNYTIYLLNKEKFLANGVFILKEDTRIASRIASVHYENYINIDSLEKKLLNEKEQIQCIASTIKSDSLETIPFGTSQLPSLEVFADGVDTMKFLTEL